MASPATALGATFPWSYHTNPERFDGTLIAHAEHTRRISFRLWFAAEPGWYADRLTPTQAVDFEAIVVNLHRIKGRGSKKWRPPLWKVESLTCVSQAMPPLYREGRRAMNPMYVAEVIRGILSQQLGGADVSRVAANLVLDARL